LKKSSPVWAFSLNHDLIFHILARHCNIPLRDGFWPDKLLTVTGNRPGTAKVSVQAEILPEDDLNRGALHLFWQGEFGVNLIRLHGALDIFAFRDGLDLCRLLPTDSQLGGYLTPLRLLNEEIGYWHRGQKVHPLNEIAYADESGRMQFLRRSLLAGAQKFNTRFSQTVPQKMLELFRSYINYVQELYVVGYSFGDAHIDLVIKNWLEFSGARSMIIVDPRREAVPPQLAHLAPQIAIKRLTAGQFFEGYREQPLTLLQKLQQEYRAASRPALEEKAAKKW
jgi:hypothetical protein